MLACEFSLTLRRTLDDGDDGLWGGGWQWVAALSPYRLERKYSAKIRLKLEINSAYGYANDWGNENDSRLLTNAYSFSEMDGYIIVCTCLRSRFFANGRV